MSSPEVESFEVTEEDLANEFNPNRRTFRQSKNQAIYGMWADDSDDERPGFGGGSGKSSKQYSAPIGFVSGGVKVGDKVTKEEEPDTESSEEEVARPSFGKSASSKPKQARGYRGKKDDIGDWEKHTTGIGKKLLHKMGFVDGKGLGKNLQGISTPVEAKKRRGKAAIGFYGTERTERSLQDFPVQPDSEEEEDNQFQEQLQQWKRGEEKKRKPKYVYKTADDLIASGGRKKVKMQSELSKVKVIDMTGKEQRVMSGYHALSQKHDKPDDEDTVYSQTQEKRAFDMPELLHNLDLLVEMAEDEIMQNSKKLNYDRDLVVNLKHEHEKMVDVCEQEEKQIDRLKKVLSLVEQCEKRMAPGCDHPLSLEDCATVFKTLHDDYYEEYKIYDLGTMALALVFPLMKQEMKGWEPLRDSSQGVKAFMVWKDLLEDPNRRYSQSQNNMDPYDRLIWDVWMPHIRTSITTKWSARDCESLIEILEVWLPVLPTWIMGNVLEQLVLPKLQQEVEDWNPLTDTMPIHGWLHPWLPLMGERLEPVYAPIRHKLANALKNWHPSDPSAKMILQPWQKVFKAGHLEAFVSKNILPKVGLALSEFVINPSHQQLDAWNWTMAWLGMAPKAGIVALLEKHFFPRWHQVLISWISSAPNYDEITKWYTGWKSLFPEALINDGAVKEQFNRALDTMNRAVSGHYQPGARENVAYLTSTERRKEMESKAAAEKRDVRNPVSSGSGASVPSNFRDLVEWKAEQNNILMVPVPGKYHEGKQVYRFGNIQIMLDRGVAFVQEGQLWMPCSVNQLILRAK